jgi:hypothetical protein
LKMLEQHKDRNISLIIDMCYASLRKYACWKQNRTSHTSTAQTLCCQIYICQNVYKHTTWFTKIYVAYKTI